MSGAVTSHVPVRQQLARDKRRGQIVALAVVTLAAALLVAFALAVSGDDEPTAASEQPVAAQLSTAITKPLSPVAGIRYDGGPEEGAVGTVSPPASSGLRYDGGPEEGSRGPAAAVH